LIKRPGVAKEGIEPVRSGFVGCAPGDSPAKGEEDGSSQSKLVTACLTPKSPRFPGPQALLYPSEPGRLRRVSSWKTGVVPPLPVAT